MPKKAIYFTTPKKHLHQTSKKIVFLHCCEPVLLCAFNAENRLQFAWAKIWILGPMVHEKAMSSLE